MSTITIGFAESKPNKRLIKSVQKIIAEQQSATDAPNIVGGTTQEKLSIGSRFKAPIQTAPIDLADLDPSTVFQYSLIENTKEEIPDDTQLFIVDIGKIYKYARSIESLLKQITKKSALLLLNPKADGFPHIILKYDGTPVSSASILAFPQLFPAAVETAEKITLISPVTFKKSQIAIEKQFVKTATQYYRDLGFIKLPLNTVNDFFLYAEQNRINLLILSKHDLSDTIKLIGTKEFSEKLKKMELSVFIA